MFPTPFYRPIATRLDDGSIVDSENAFTNYSVFCVLSKLNNRNPNYVFNLVPENKHDRIQMFIQVTRQIIGDSSEPQPLTYMDTASLQKEIDLAISEDSDFCVLYNPEDVIRSSDGIGEYIPIEWVRSILPYVPLPRETIYKEGLLLAKYKDDPLNDRRIHDIEEGREETYLTQYQRDTTILLKGLRYLYNSRVIVGDYGVGRRVQLFYDDDVQNMSYFTKYDKPLPTIVFVPIDSNDRNDTNDSYQAYLYQIQQWPFILEHPFLFLNNDIGFPASLKNTIRHSIALNLNDPRFFCDRVFESYDKLSSIFNICERIEEGRKSSRKNPNEFCIVIPLRRSESENQEYIDSLIQRTDKLFKNPSYVMYSNTDPVYGFILSILLSYTPSSPKVEGRNPVYWSNRIVSGK
jgi:hypothetical protein